MHLLNLTLQTPGSVTCAIVGNFSGSKQQEIAICRAGTRVEILKVDTELQRLDTIFGAESFGGIRSMVPFKLTGQGKGEHVAASSLPGFVLLMAFARRLPHSILGFRSLVHPRIPHVSNSTLCVALSRNVR